MRNDDGQSPPIPAITDRDGTWVPADLMHAIESSLAEAGITGLSVSMSFPAHVAVGRILTHNDHVIAQDLADNHWVIEIRPAAR